MSRKLYSYNVVRERTIAVVWKSVESCKVKCALYECIERETGMCLKSIQTSIKSCL